MLVSSALIFRVMQIRCWAAVCVCIKQLSTVDAQPARLDVCMRPTYALQPKQQDSHAITALCVTTAVKTVLYVTDTVSLVLCVTMHDVVN